MFWTYLVQSDTADQPSVWSRRVRRNGTPLFQQRLGPIVTIASTRNSARSRAKARLNINGVKYRPQCCLLCQAGVLVYGVSMLHPDVGLEESKTADVSQPGDEELLLLFPHSFTDFVANKLLGWLGRNGCTPTIGRERRVYLFSFCLLLSQRSGGGCGPWSFSRGGHGGPTARRHLGRRRLSCGCSL